jgi:hypothetical protein
LQKHAKNDEKSIVFAHAQKLLEKDFYKAYNCIAYEVGVRDIAQLGSALPWGGRGHEFKSHCSDHLIKDSPV